MALFSSTAIIHYALLAIPFERRSLKRNVSYSLFTQKSIANELSIFRDARIFLKLRYELFYIFRTIQ